MSGATNGTSRQVQIVSRHGEEACPTCQSPITRQMYERIMKIDEARQKQIADERAAIERERAEVAEERTKIASAAVAAERTKWEIEVARTQREAERQARAHEKELQAEIRRREIREKKLAREMATAEAKATREAKRAVGAEVVELRAALKKSEERRRRDEDVMKQTVADLARKAEDRDRAHFGPEGEEDLLKALREQFPGDKIEHRGTGGDILMTVIDGSRPAGKIIFEIKNTKTFQREYLRQTRTAMEMHSTMFGMLVTRALPAGNTGMFLRGGVIVTVPAIATQVVAVVRQGIISIFRLRLSESGKSEKMEALFDYLRGDDFRTSVQGLQEKLVELRESLARERSHHDGWWSVREHGYAALLRGVAGIDSRVNELLGGEVVERPRAKALAPKIAGPDRHRTEER